MRSTTHEALRPTPIHAAELTPRAWVGVVSRSHVQRGVGGGFAQLCHGKQAPLRRMQVGDWLVYYSPRTCMDGGDPLRAFTAIGRVTGEDVRPFDMGGGFVPWRRDIDYLDVRREVAFVDVRNELRFARGSTNFGLLARRGHFEIPIEDAMTIAEAMTRAA